MQTVDAFLEIGNVLITCERRGHISYAQTIRCLTLLENLRIQIDNQMAEKVFYDIFALAHAEKLTIYEAAYLELAMRLQLPLATKDSQLNKVAKQLGVKVLL